MQQRLYGVVGKVNSHGLSELVPIFKDETTGKFFRLEDGEESEVDISRYGKAKRLPITMKEIMNEDMNEEYFVLWDSEKCVQGVKGALSKYWGGNETMESLIEAWKELNIRIAICDNKAFMISKEV